MHKLAPNGCQVLHAAAVAHAPRAGGHRYMKIDATMQLLRYFYISKGFKTFEKGQSNGLDPVLTP